MDTQETHVPEYSLVLPVYNEEDTLPELYVRLCELLERLDGDAEVIFVDDGSRDRTYPILLDLQRRDSRFKIIQFSRNFGHQVAITAGMDYARGHAVVVMDADLQDPPEVVLEMAARWREGYEIVYAEREERLGESWFKRTSAALFYRLQRRLANVNMPANVGDFRLVDRKALDAFKSMRERGRYVRGMFSWVGFRQVSVKFVRPARFAGRPQYTFLKSLRLALDAMIGFSNVPLRLALSMGSLVSALSVLYGLWAVVWKLAGKNVPGWTSLAVLVTFLGGIQLIVMGVVGEYLGRIYEEVKGRPLYVIRDARGFTTEQAVVLPASAESAVCATFALTAGER